MTQRQDFNGEVTKITSYSHACNSPKSDLVLWGTEHAAAPAGSWWAESDSDIWNMTFLNCWLWNLTSKLPVLQIAVLLVVH